MQIEDVSPTIDTHTNTLPVNIRQTHQSASGKSLCVAISKDGNKVYVGGHSGVWISDNGGETFYHSAQIQPFSPIGPVSGAMLSPNVYDLLISPTNNNIVLAATGRDGRRPTKAGIYRSVDGGKTWRLVHQFLKGLAISGDVGRLVVAPDNPLLMFAAGGFSVAVSNDGGTTWINKVPQVNTNDSVWYVVAGPQGGTVRRVYAAGSHIWYSKDGGNTWRQDATNLSLGPPSDAAGFGSLTVAIHPSNPAIIYLIKRFGDEHVELWKGNFSNFDSAGQATWNQLPPIPINYPNVTPSGCTFIVPCISKFNGTLYLIASDSRTTHISFGEPLTTSDWKRIDSNIHLDPHGLALTPDFEHAFLSPANFGRIVIVNDGGLYFSNDGARTWIQGRGLSTLTILNAAILPRARIQPSICIGTTDNNGFFSFNGGTNWRTQDYIGGDNDWCFADPLQASRLIVFAPRIDPGAVRLYVNNVGWTADGSHGTSQGKTVPGLKEQLTTTEHAWNVVSNFANAGYRPLILTPGNQNTRPGSDFIVITQSGSRIIVQPSGNIGEGGIAKLCRTTSISRINNRTQWTSPGSSEDPNSIVFQEGPNLPDPFINIVQASDGHDFPVFYVADLLSVTLTDPGTGSMATVGGKKKLWKWKRGMSIWEPIVPVTSGHGPSKANRFFVDPYRSSQLYVLDMDHIYRSDNGGQTWIIDALMEQVLTEAGSFPFNIGNTTNPEDALVRDMAFDPSHSTYRFAAGPAGVFYTSDGINWKAIIRTAANPMHPTTLTYDFVSNPWVGHLYVSTSNRGLLRIKIRTSVLSLRGILEDRGVIFPVSIAVLTQIFGRPRPISLEDFFSKIKRN